MHAAIPDLDDLVDGHVQEIAVVRNQHESERVVAKIFFQPVARFEVEVIGRLVEQQQIRLFEQQLGQRDAHLPAAGKFLGSAMPLRVRKAEAGQNRANLRFDGVTVARAEFAVELMKAIGHLRVFGAGRIQLRHLLGEVLHFAFHVVERREHRHAFGEDAAPGQRKPVLRKVSRADAAGHAERPVVERLDPRQHLQQRRLAGAVGAHQTRTVLGRDQPIQIFEQQLRAEALARPG